MVLEPWCSAARGEQELLAASGLCAHTVAWTLARGRCLVRLMFTAVWRVQEIVSEALNLESVSAQTSP